MAGKNTKSKGRGKAKGGKGKKKKSEKFQTIGARAGLSMPVPRIRRKIREGQYASKMTKTTPIYLAAVLEYLGVILRLSLSPFLLF